MAEDSKVPKHQQFDELSRDDMSALSYVLQHVRGSSPSSMSPLFIDDVEA